jgi:hypothetical protein
VSTRLSQAGLKARAGLKTRLYVGVLMCAAFATSHTLLAHHSFAMFDTAKRVTMRGTVTGFEWTNPHAYIEIDVPDDKGVVKHWSVELGSPSILMQAGWKFSDVKVNDKITVVLNPLRSGEAGGLLVTVTVRDGRVLGNGPGRVGGQP